MTDSSPPHHGPDGFRNPWPTFQQPTQRDVLKWQRERRTRALPPNPGQGEIPTATPRVIRPAGHSDELRATWIGHSSWLLQLGGLNVLTDPQLSHRASPFQRWGPARFTPPALGLADLPPIDLVLLSHDHYDHLDEPTVRGLHRRFGDRVRWVTPLGHERWFARRGIRAQGLDWWEEAVVEGDNGQSLLVGCLPAQHWSSRTPWDRMKRLWSSWSVASGTHRVYFAGDSGWFPEYGRIGEVVGPIDLSLFPIGAYEPRWFMRASHMNPEEAVQAYLEMGGSGVLSGMHWGAFRLTDEDPREPPTRLRAAWEAAGLPGDRLWIAAVGETRAFAAVPRP